MRTHPVAFALCAVGLVVPEAVPAQASFDSDGVRIHYVVRGSGPAVLLIHGFGITAEMNWGWSGLLDSLAASHTVVAPDLRGHGRSGKPHEPDAYGIEVVNDLVRLLDHLGLARANVVGYSMGGAVALKLLTAHPERVIRAVIGGAGWAPPDQPPPDFLIAWLGGLDRAADEGTPLADVLRLPGVPPYSPEITAVLNANDPRALAAVIRGGGGFAVTEAALRAVTVPVLAVTGEADAMALAGVERLRAVLPAVEVTVLPGADHVSALGHPELRRAIARFIEQR